MRDLELLGSHLESPVTVTLVGAAMGVLIGQPDRTTSVIGIWKRRTQGSMPALQDACAKAGILFAPPDASDEAGSRPRILDGDSLQIGEYPEERAISIFTSGNLTVVRPPVENLVAAGLCRGEPEDINDIAWLHAQFGVDTLALRKAVDSFDASTESTRRMRESALKHLPLLEVFSSSPVSARSGAGKQPHSENPRRLENEILDALGDPYGVAKVLLRDDRHLLREIVAYAWAPPDVEFAATDPAAFTTRRRQVTRFFLQGWGLLAP